MSSKLLRLKKWLTLEDSAKHLSILIDDEVSIADIFQFCLEGLLTVSVYFPNDQPAQQLLPTPIADARVLTVRLPKEKGCIPNIDWQLIEQVRFLVTHQGAECTESDWTAFYLFLSEHGAEYPGNMEKNSYPVFIGAAIEIGGETIILEEKPGGEVNIINYWDLMLSSSGLIELENQYLKEIGAATKTSLGWGGLILRHSVNQDWFVGLQSYLPELSDNENVETTESSQMLALLGLFGKKYWAADSLPVECHLAISTAELRRFVSSLNEPEPTAVRASDSEATELTRIQRTLAALAHGLARKYPAYKHGNKPNVSQLAKLATEHLRDATSDRTPHGFSETTARQTIAEGLKVCPDLTNS